MLIPPHPIEMSKLNMFEQVEQVLKVLKMLTFLGAAFLSNWLLNEVSPLDETALVTAVSIPSNVRLETSLLGPMTTGPTKSEARWGMILHAKRSYLRHRAFPRSPEGARTLRKQ